VRQGDLVETIDMGNGHDGGARREGVRPETGGMGVPSFMVQTFTPVSTMSTDVILYLLRALRNSFD
jgi:hypothetical protein